MKTCNGNVGMGRARGLWPVLLVLLAATLVPMACVLWFMNAAMQNERLAVRQKLTDVYRQKVQTDQGEIAAFWTARTKLPAESMGAELFAKIVRSGLADSVVVRGEAGAVVYPAALPLAEAPQPSSQPSDDANSPCAKAGSLEYAQGQPLEAAAEHAKIAAASKDATSKARALAAEARCFAKAKGDSLAKAVMLVKTDLSQEQYRNVTDTQGRLIVPNAQLLVLERMAAAGASAQSRPAESLGIEADLRRRLGDYHDSSMSAAQRLFLMEALQENKALRELSPASEFDTLPAEELAWQYLQSPQPPAQRLRVAPTALAGLWQMGFGDGNVILLFQEGKLTSDLKAAGKLNEPFAGITTRLELPGRRPPGKEPFLAVPASGLLPGWELAVYLNEDPFAVSAHKAEQAHLAVGISAISLIALLAVAMATYLGRQIHLTRLKNDLIATVSHELKTPLASMRVLVDTLREGRYAGPQQASEYFELIAKENERLSRLIDNFLTFSRMERNKRTFEFAAASANEFVQAAADAVRDRFSSPQCQLTLDVPACLPLVRADSGAMQTVILNLLDNAWKYSGPLKAVEVRAYAADSKMFIEVSDNGVGISRRALRRIFDRFYQVDQTLSRKAGGCGLGLSIVQFILDAHGGTIGVKSSPGKGSTFTVALPLAAAPEAKQATR